MRDARHKGLCHDLAVSTENPSGNRKPPIVDRDFAERFLRAVDRPFDYGVYFLFHDWWAEAPQDAIDSYAAILEAKDGFAEFYEQRHIADPLHLDDLADHAPGTLGQAYRSFIVDHDLEANLATNYHEFHARLAAQGALDRLPDTVAFAIVRGFQIHDFLHVLTNSSPRPNGELRMAAFHFGQLQFPYHAMRMAVTAGHLAFVNPEAITGAMDAIAAGWILGRAAQNLHFARWEDELDTPLDELRAAWGIQLDLVGSAGSLVR